MTLAKGPGFPEAVSKLADERMVTTEVVILRQSQNTWHRDVLRKWASHQSLCGRPLSPGCVQRASGPVGGCSCVAETMALSSPLADDGSKCTRLSVASPLRKGVVSVALGAVGCATCLESASGGGCAF